jgi:GTPase
LSLTDEDASSPSSPFQFFVTLMFIDEAKIRIKAGDGGNGCMAFRREKFVPRGGPSGGDGGRGGDIIMESSERHNTLVHFRFNPEYKAQRGRHGEGSNCTGSDGEPIILKVPVGTTVYDEETGVKVHDFSQPDERIVIAKGGRGGRGNQHFATPTHQAPREHELGRPGEERTLRLELKLLADVGLVGYPNVGKSTLISRISAARPKIADYPFTTLQPNLGVVTIGELPDEESYVVADIPGLIEGAHEGHGLGIQFLRHIERTRLLLHVIDVSEASGRPDPVKDFEVIMQELESFGAGLEEKPMMVVATKLDVAEPKRLEKLRKFCAGRGYPFLGISAVVGTGISKLKYDVGAMVRQMREGKYEGPRPAGASVPKRATVVKTTKTTVRQRPSTSRKETVQAAARRTATSHRTSGKAKAAKRPKKLSGKRRSAR